jgi:hypothetical protein
MSDFLDRFGEDGKFSAARQGTIVGLLCIGTLVGCLLSGWVCDRIGRRFTISSSAFFYIIGVIIEVTSSTQWVQFAMGRFTYVYSQRRNANARPAQEFPLRISADRKFPQCWYWNRCIVHKCSYVSIRKCPEEYQRSDCQLIPTSDHAGYLDCLHGKKFFILPSHHETLCNSDLNFLVFQGN